MSGVLPEVGDGKKKKKTWSPHSVNWWPVAEIANEQKISVLPAKYWVLRWGSERGKRDIQCIIVDYWYKKWLPKEVISLLPKKDVSQVTRLWLRVKREEEVLLPAHAWKIDWKNIITHLVVWEGLQKLYALLSIIITLSVMESSAKHNGIFFEVHIEFYCLSVLPTTYRVCDSDTPPPPSHN